MLKKVILFSMLGSVLLGQGSTPFRPDIRVFSARLRKPGGRWQQRFMAATGSECVALGEPVMPVADSFDSGIVTVNGS